LAKTLPDAEVEAQRRARTARHPLGAMRR